MRGSEYPLEPCWCRWPKPGPLYWDFRCLKCGGEIQQRSIVGAIRHKLFGGG